MTPITLEHRGVLYQATDKEIGELSRHLFRWFADRKCAKANAQLQGPPTSGYRVVQRNGRYIVVAFQNLPVTS